MVDLALRMATGRTPPAVEADSVPEAILERNMSPLSSTDTLSNKSTDSTEAHGPPIPIIPVSMDLPMEDDIASCRGHGTLEILEVTKILEAQGIPCCLVGVSALMYYGAGRGRHVWEKALCYMRHYSLTNEPLHRTGRFVFGRT